MSSDESDSDSPLRRLFSTAKGRFQLDLCTDCSNGDDKNYSCFVISVRDEGVPTRHQVSLLKWRVGRRSIYTPARRICHKGEKRKKVYQLQKVLYELKQAPRAWNIKIDSYFKPFGLIQSLSEPSLYVKVGVNGNFLIVCLYVDDVIYARIDMKMVEDFKRAMIKEFEMFDLGLMMFFLCFQVKQ
ncbi:hypothetical protein PVK06_007313 [Gossypium arboreum]|uniref:Reverse transcriptase Ty1/copia-type domain-containing protein n=1 Tax=Gossypium arboreum TaxID=29729 RepID=A0ABR0QHR5_GOSAR|nr:hypothetical protein PVK06_007313 [Gossypium arboreum]